MTEKDGLRAKLAAVMEDTTARERRFTEEIVGMRFLRVCPCIC
jgi:hypothetical protein